MAKSLRSIVEKKEEPKSGFQPNSPAEKRFIEKHVILKHHEDEKDVYGNGPEFYKGKIVKYAERMKERHGYDVGTDHHYYEETEKDNDGLLSEDCTDEDRKKAWIHHHNEAMNWLKKIETRLSKHKKHIEKHENDEDSVVRHPVRHMRDIAAQLESFYHDKVTGLAHKDDHSDTDGSYPSVASKPKKFVHGTKQPAGEYY